MKIIFFKSIVISSVFLFSFFSATAQKDFRDGYVVLTSGDTLHGEINYQSYKHLSNFCVFRKNKGEKVTTYLPTDLSAFRFKDNKLFISRKIQTSHGDKKEKYFFIEWVVKGKIDLYYYRDDYGDHFLIENKQQGLRELTYTEKHATTGAKSYVFRSTSHIQFLTLYMLDAPQLQPKIKAIAVPEYKPLLGLIKEYNTLFEKEVPVEEYRKRLPLTKVCPELVAGFTHYTIDDVAHNANFQYGALVHLWLPLRSERFYLRTGVILNTKILTHESTAYVHYTNYRVREEILEIRIPVQLEYIGPPSKWIRPTVAYGANFFVFSSSLTVGAKMKVYKAMHVSVMSDLEFNSKLVLIPVGIRSYSFLTGVYVEF